MNVNFPIDFDRLWRIVQRDFGLPAESIHGPAHWRRVERHGRLLARQTGAREDVVRLFALLHDSQRITEGEEPGHGRRAADYARSLRGDRFALDDAGFGLLLEACRSHSDCIRNADPTIGTCLDADRLDRCRAGAALDPNRLSTEFGRWLAGRADLPALLQGPASDFPKGK